jgi:AcrR family transcriptional regulator
MPPATPEPLSLDDDTTDWHRRVVGRSLKTATQRSIDRGSSLVQAAATLLERSHGDGFTVQDVADEAGQSLRTLYQYFESKDDLLLAVFEEAMRTYARMIHDAVARLEDPLERLAGAMLAAVRMPEFSDTGVDRGLARLRFKLGEVDPDLVARSQQPLATLFRGLLTAAADAGQIRSIDPAEATYLILALESTFITSRTLGNDFGVQLPNATTVTRFCLGGLGAAVDDAWLKKVNTKVRMPSRLSMSASPKPKRRAPARRAKEGL